MWVTTSEQKYMKSWLLDIGMSGRRRQVRHDRSWKDKGSENVTGEGVDKENIRGKGNWRRKTAMATPDRKRMTGEEDEREYN